jgi:hypothetical protein
MRLPQRLIAATVLVALTTVLGGCSSSTNFDPSDLLDFLDSKKKLPGDRKPVFPDGVPGLEQGVPKELYKGSAQEQQDQQALQNPQTATAAPPPAAEDPKAKKSKGKKARQPAAAAPDGAQQPAAEADPNAPADANAPTESEGAAPAVPPAPKPKKIVRRRITAPPPDQQAAQPAQQAAPAQQQSAAPFPAPLPSSTFQR